MLLSFIGFTHGIKANISSVVDGKDDDWVPFDDDLEAGTEAYYGLTPEEYSQNVIPEQYIIGFDETKVSNATTYVAEILRKGGFNNATALWHYQTTTFTGVTVAGVDDRLYAAFQDDPNVVFIEPVSTEVSYSEAAYSILSLELI
jgi:hypothetical protein